MEAYLQTRGQRRADDYRFLASHAPQPWWARYRDNTIFEDPTILVHSDGERWQVYLSGIPSARRDTTNAVIRYTVALEGAANVESGKDAELALAMVSAWLDDLVDDPALGRLTHELDERFDETVVERLYREPDGADDVRDLVMAAATALSPASRPEPEEWPEHWLGSVSTNRARQAFLARAARALDGEAGRALYLNVRATADEAQQLIGKDDPMTGILVDDPKWLGVAVIPLKKKREAPPEPPPSEGPDWRVVLLAAGSLTLLVILLLWEAWRKITGR